jgi:REP element-mobilizing transposase RayT
MPVEYDYKPKESKDDFGWYGRKRLPHLDAESFEQFITFRLADSLPRPVLDSFREKSTSDFAFRRRVERYLDAGHGQCVLKHHEIASVVRESIFFYAGSRYGLIAWVIMPNHVHMLLAVMAGEHLPNIMHSIKSFTANRINKLLDRSGQLWQHESFDRYIRDSRHHAATVKYIENNPVKARLCLKASEWEFSSAYGRE